MCSVNTIYVFATDRWDLFTVAQSTLHEAWARKYSGSLETRSPLLALQVLRHLRLSPPGSGRLPTPALQERGERYHAHREELMLSLWLGLTKIYNLFHARDLSREMVSQRSRRRTPSPPSVGFDALIELRRLHVALDLMVRDAYGWQDLDLEHGFHEVETLPENDRVRYTISPAARREVLKRLLAENHTPAKSNAQKSVPSPTRGGHKHNATTDGPDFFGGVSHGQ